MERTRRDIQPHGLPSERIARGHKAEASESSGLPYRQNLQAFFKAVSFEGLAPFSVVEWIVRVEPVALRVHFQVGDLRQFRRLNEKLLLGPAKCTCFYLYVILDIFSRYVTGWMVAMRESAEQAKRAIYGGMRMARRRFQYGSLFQRGTRRKVWVARWWEEVINPDGNIGRRRRAEVLGTVAEIGSRLRAMDMLSKRLNSINSGSHRPQSMR